MMDYTKIRVCGKDFGPTYYISEFCLYRPDAPLPSAQDDYGFHTLHSRVPTEDLAKEFGLSIIDGVILRGRLGSLDEVKRLVFKAVGHFFFVRSSGVYGPGISLYELNEKGAGTNCTVTAQPYKDLSKEDEFEIRKSFVNRMLSDSVSRIV